MPGEETKDCTREEFVAGYDSKLGIDVFLRLLTGFECTLQEKFLFTGWNTVTVEYYQNRLTKEPGDWFKLNVSYYFVGYDPTQCLQFHPWVLLDWTGVQRATAQGRITWRLKPCSEDNARASFKYVKMDELPTDVCVASSWSTG